MISVTVYALWAKKTLLLPEKWEELSPAQYCGICEAIYEAGENKVALKIELLKILTGLKRWQLKFLGVENVIKLMALTEWTLEKPQFIKQLLPVVKVKNRPYFGPYEAISNLVNIEFKAAEQHIKEWRAYSQQMTETPELLTNLWQDVDALMHLYRFVATIYRPGKEDYDHVADPEGDIREKYNPNTVEARAKLFFKEMPVSYAKAILLWYQCCREFMYLQYEDIFSGGGEEVQENNGDSYFKMMRAIAKEGTYGDFDKVEYMFIYNMLEELVNCKEDAERMKADDQQFSIPEDE